jgi:predicted AAA+ superfamily ATPase
VRVQADLKWGITLKTIYDRTKNVFIFATGSSALHLNTNADITRRAIFEKLHPLSFSEFVKIKHGIEEVPHLSEDLGKVVFESNTATEVFSGLQLLQPKIEAYLMQIGKFELAHYIGFGSLPFMISLNNEANK